MQKRKNENILTMAFTVHRHRRLLLSGMVFRKCRRGVFMWWIIGAVVLIFTVIFILGMCRAAR